MKKLTPARKKWLRRRQLRLARRQKADRSKLAVLTLVTQLGVSKGKATRGKPLPAVLSFNRAPEETLHHLDLIRSSVDSQIERANGRQYPPKSKHRNASVRRYGQYRPFDEVEHISLSAALVLASNYERLRTVTSAENFIVNPAKWDNKVFRILQGIGFFAIYGIEHLSPEWTVVDEDDFTVLRMKSGETADPVAVNTFLQDLLSLYPGSEEESDGSRLNLYGSLIEAVVNVVRHAYPQNGTKLDGSFRRWWMTGMVDRRKRRMTAVVLDHGVTIPVSLPNWDKYAGVMRKLFTFFNFVPAASDTRSDGHAIAAAVEESASSTGDSHRGYGLAQMRSFVDSCEEGHLRIISRHGEVVFRPRKAPEIKSYEAKLAGTLVEWNVQL